MGYERNQRGVWRNDDNGQDEYGREPGFGRDDGYSSARDYAAAGRYGERPSRDRWSGAGNQRHRDDYRPGFRDQDRYGARDDLYGNRDAYGYGSRGYGRDADYGRGYGNPRNQDRYGSPYAGRGQDQRQRGYSGQPQGYEYEDRGFFDRAGDEVRSWFGDDEAERRRELDRRYDERYGDSWGERDEHYSTWRRQRIGELDRDYDEYRRENATKFENDFNSFRTERQTQRTSLNQVSEHMEVVGSDGEHVGTVDKIRGDRIILTKNDVDAGGRHHSIPSRWLQSVDDKVTIRKTAAEAKSEWRDEERNQAIFGDEQNSRRSTEYGTDPIGTRGNLNRSFSGTY